MKFGPLSLFTRTSCRKTFNVASWHSRHSLTWRWILSFRIHEPWTFRPWTGRGRGWRSGFGAGLGQFLAFDIYRDTAAGWTWAISVLWRSIDYKPQRPMWYRDLYGRARDERDASQSAERRLRREIEAIQHNAARAENPTAIHLN